MSLHAQDDIAPSPAHLSRLSQYFGVPSFRGLQYSAVLATLAGQDSLVVLPTGAGKSLTFQFPPHALDKGFTVIVGPLLSLMKDQVAKCLDLGLEASLFNSDCSEAQKQQLIRDLVSDEPLLRLVYTTPESLMQPRLRQALQEAMRQGTLISFAIDEAHCISDWGHDFRAAYLHLSTLKDDFPNIPIAALSATCTPLVQKSITSLLKLKNPAIIKDSFNRQNIEYQVRYKELLGSGNDEDIVQDLEQFIRSRPQEGGIIYARTRKTCDWLAEALNDLLSDLDLEVGCYHAGKDPVARARVQREWSEGAVSIVVATIAFGMGIDRPDVRWVVHFNVPSSPESFMQESGRGGRDGKPSIAVLYFSQADMQEVQRLGRSSSKAHGLEAMESMCMRVRCRRQTLLEHFEEKRGVCGSAAGELPCDVCQDIENVRRCLHALTSARANTSVAARVKAQMMAQATSNSELRLSVSSAGTMQCSAQHDQQQPVWAKHANAWSSASVLANVLNPGTDHLVSRGSKQPLQGLDQHVATSSHSSVSPPVAAGADSSPLQVPWGQYQQAHATPVQPQQLAAAPTECQSEPDVVPGQPSQAQRTVPKLHLRGSGRTVNTNTMAPFRAPRLAGPRLPQPADGSINSTFTTTDRHPGAVMCGPSLAMYKVNTPVTSASQGGGNGTTCIKEAGLANGVVMVGKRKPQLGIVHHEQPGVSISKRPHVMVQPAPL